MMNDHQNCRIGVTQCPHCGMKFSISPRPMRTSCSTAQFEGRRTCCPSCHQFFVIRLQCAAPRRNANRALVVVHSTARHHEQRQTAPDNWNWNGPGWDSANHARTRSPDIRSTAASTNTQDVAFNTWYSPRIGVQPVWAQIVLWTFGYGFLWVPIYYWLWRWERTRAIRPSTAWIWRIAIPLAAFVVYRECRRQSHAREQAQLIAEAIETRRKGW